MMISKDDLAHLPMRDRCPHNVDVQSMRCTNCRGPYYTVRDDVRPYQDIINDKKGHNQRQD